MKSYLKAINTTNYQPTNERERENTMKNTIITLVAIIIATSNLTVSACGNVMVPATRIPVRMESGINHTTKSHIVDTRSKYTKEIAVISFDDNGNKVLDVFYDNGQIHTFSSDLVKCYSIGQIVKVKFNTKRTKRIKDDEPIRVRKSTTSELNIIAYADDCKFMYDKMFGNSNFGKEN